MEKSYLFKRGALLVLITFIPELLIYIGLEFDPLLFQAIQFMAFIPLILFVSRLIKKGLDNKKNK